MIKEGMILGWIAAIFFGAGIPLLVLQMMTGKNYLRIDREGFYLGTIRKEATKNYWKDIEMFGVTTMNGVSYVSWNYAPTYKKEKVSRKINLTLRKMEAMLPDTYGFKAVELATLMNEYKQNQASEATAYGRTSS